MSGVARSVVALVAIASIASAQGLPDPFGNDSRATPPAPNVAIEQAIDPETYVCGPGDVFELNFWGPQTFRLRISVDLEGRTFISKVGFVAVAGKSLAAARTAIKSKVRGTYPGLQ